MGAADGQTWPKTWTCAMTSCLRFFSSTAASFICSSLRSWMQQRVGREQGRFLGRGRVDGSMAEGRQSAPPQARIDKGRKLRPHQVGLHLLDGLVWDGKTELLFGSCEAEPELPPCPEAGLRAGTLTRQSLHSTANAFAMLCCAMLALAASTHGIREEARHLLARIARAEPGWMGEQAWSINAVLLVCSSNTALPCPCPHGVW